jgi:hypothetical protein
MRSFPPLVMTIRPMVSGSPRAILGNCSSACSLEIVPEMLRLTAVNLGKTERRQIPFMSGNSSSGFPAIRLK